MNFLQCLPEWLSDILKNQNNVREIRLRNDSAVKVNVNGKWYWCGADKLVASCSSAIKLDIDCEQIVKKACNNSIYAYEYMLANGYFTLQDGSRFGVAGEYSFSGNVFKNYTSVCVRIPHCVTCASAEMIKSTKNANSLIIGGPGTGKTTLLRDMAKQLSSSDNVVVVDERGELAIASELDCCDVLKWTSKAVGFQIAVRSLSPNFVVCDEIANKDFDCIMRAISSGVNVLATLHATSLQEACSNLGELLQLFDNVFWCKRVSEVVSLKSRKLLIALH